MNQSKDALSAESHRAQGFIYHKLGKHKEAVKIFKKAIEIKPDYSLAYFNLSMAYVLLGNKKKSLECFTKLASLDPNSPWAYHNLGAYYLQEKEFTKAEGYF